MNLIFLNSLEKAAGKDPVRSAQVSIYESQGEWNVLWSEQADDGGELQTRWYEGMDWKEMIAAFRRGVREKVREGFTPLVDGMGDKDRRGASVGLEAQRLHFYAERNVAAELYEQLRQWRREQAQKEGVAAYIIAPNRLLQMIGAFLPQTAEELQQLPGMGERRAGAYGPALLAITGGCDRQTPGFPLGWVAETTDAEEFAAWQDRQIALREQSDRDRQERKRMLLEAVLQGGTLESMQKQLTINRRDLLLSIEDLDKEGYDVASLIEAELKEVEPGEKEQAEKLFRELGDRYLKPVVSQLYSEEQLKEKDVSRVYEWLRLYRLKYRRQAG